MSSVENRRLSDQISGGEISLLEIVLKLNSQDQKIEEIRSQLRDLATINKSIDKLVTEFDLRKADFESIAEQQNQLNQHRFLIKILSGILVLIFPSILAWAVYITDQLTQLATKVEVQAIKIQQLEKSYEASNFTPSEVYPPRDIWTVNGRYFHF
jgi:outer membrane murein-binding lipoprotein Lpp